MPERSLMHWVSWGKARWALWGELLEFMCQEKLHCSWLAVRCLGRDTNSLSSGESGKVFTQQHTPQEKEFGECLSYSWQQRESQKFHVHKENTEKCHILFFCEREMISWYLIFKIKRLLLHIPSYFRPVLPNPNIRLLDTSLVEKQ